jgi:hypothetical protein
LGEPRLPLLLATNLSEPVAGAPDAIAFVQKVASSFSPKATQLIKTMTNFHCSMFAMSEGHPDNDRLMALH